MADYFLKQFYDAVKDPSWPEVNTYNDFVALPDKLKQECYNVHNFEQRKAQLESKQYWSKSGIGIAAFRFENVVFVTNHKCASTYYSDLFTKLGWEQVQTNEINLNDYKVFGLILHPFTRYFKGLAQSLVDSCIESMSDTDVTWHKDCFKRLEERLEYPEYKNFLQNVTVTDMHSAPYQILFGNDLNTIDWIPLEAGDQDQIKEYIEKFLHAHGISIHIPRNDKRLNQATGIKKKLYGVMKELFADSNESHKWLVYYLFADDLKFYHTLIENFNPNGATWDEISWLSKAS